MKVTKAALAKANQPIVGTMLVSEARAIKAKKAAVIRKFEKAALAHIKATEGRDLEAEVAGWLPYRVEANAQAAGVVIVRQYAAHEKAPDTLRQTWRINKNLLVK